MEISEEEHVHHVLHGQLPGGEVLHLLLEVREVVAGELGPG